LEKYAVLLCEFSTNDNRFISTFEENVSIISGYEILQAKINGQVEDSLLAAGGRHSQRLMAVIIYNINI
jgi:hypothetical protein